jgi:uncharacterized protein YndB with AHSA1/START domain
MKIVKRIVLAVLILIAIPLVVGLFVKQDFRVERSAVIDQPMWDVFEYVKYLKNQDNFSKWAAMDPNMQKWHKGKDGEMGFIAGWKSQNKEVGEGEQEILRITPGERIDYELRFKKPFESKSEAYFTFEKIDSRKTKVLWGIEGKMPYPMNIMLLLTDMETMLGDDLNAGLGNLKVLLESKADSEQE